MLIAFFYLTAAQHFGYTPEGTFASLTLSTATFQDGPAGGAAELPGTPHPVWGLVLVCGKGFGLQPLLTAKVFSLFLSSIALLLVFLLCHEVTEDRLLSLCASMVVAFDSRMLENAAAGSVLSLVLVVGLGAVFFLLRNEYLLSVLLTAVLSLLCWQGVVLLALIVADLLFNSRVRVRALKVIAGMLLVYAAGLLPWLFYALWSGRPAVPVLAASMLLPSLSPLEIVSTVVSCLIVLLAVVRRRGGIMHPEGIIRRAMVPLVLALTLSASSAGAGAEWAFLGFPLLVVCTLEGWVQLTRRFYGTDASAVPGLLISTLMLLVTQTSYHHSSRPRMAGGIADLEGVRQIAAWVHANVPQEATISADPRWSLAYYAERAVAGLSDGMPPVSEIVVTSRPDVPGYALVYSPTTEIAGGVQSTVGRCSVWKR
jgi:hypothetical protein